MIPTIAVSMGDYNGIGPEVALKCILKQSLSKTTPLFIGQKVVFDFYTEKLGFQIPHQSITKPEEIKQGIVNIWNSSEEDEIDIEPGELSQSAGTASMKAVGAGIDLCLNGYCDALVTSPISKEAIHKAGYTVPGHTEFLADRTSTKDFLMILVSGKLRVGLVTGHIPLNDVADQIRKNLIVRQIRTLNHSLKHDFGIRTPKIAVMGLNPHAGDGGVLGSEESLEITPAVQTVRGDDILAEGPYPADGFFGSRMDRKYDAILAMYHDQGLVPFKTLSFGTGINFTAGLPIIRTSPDHGTAFDIAGQNRADDQSFTAAYHLAADMAITRSKTDKNDK
jgi:4-hydroxythreonine-4-phosphate dehydrogenase